MLAALDIDGVTRLTVRQLRCVAHGRSVPGESDFVANTPSAFKQICDFVVITQPRIQCQTATIVVTRGA